MIGGCAVYKPSLIADEDPTNGAMCHALAVGDANTKIEEQHLFRIPYDKWVAWGEAKLTF